MTSFAKVIALDGPSGSGKSSVAREVAKRLSMVYIDTGAMYRALGWYIDSLHIPFVEGPLLTQALSGAHLIYAKDPKVLISINGVDLTQTIREHRVSDLASRISKIPQVRNYLLDFQRNLGQETTSIMEGRDIGTVIFPSAFCKIFMTASEET
ncbi:MAG: (d)CMP kinase, partial [Bacteriovoracaceae bacterium]|nr:(d)CMP kinase [Bacteriovoracaceae bacterium]